MAVAPPSVTYVLNLKRYLCLEPAPWGCARWFGLQQSTINNRHSDFDQTRYYHMGWVNGGVTLEKIRDFAFFWVSVGYVLGSNRRDEDPHPQTAVG